MRIIREKEKPLGAHSPRGYQEIMRETMLGNPIM